LLLENLRYHSEEEANNASFAKQLASLADVFVQDAFGAVHRAHASTAGVAALLPSAAGLLLAKEIFFLSKAMENPERPFIAILGGSKVSDKIAVIDSLLEKVNGLVIGGAMAYTFMKAQGIGVGNSRVEADKVDLAKNALKKAQEKHIQVFLPQDHVIVDQVDAKASYQVTPDRVIPDGKIGVDIGPNTVKSLFTLLQKAKTVVWNGPMGIFEMAPFAAGTLGVAKALAEATEHGATTIVGGGDSVAAVKQAGLADKLTHISTGGGASLEFLEGKTLPGIAALPNV
jgi:3-phosphoglycerate kinase